MESRNGTDYTQNYDIIVRWMADALRGQTLEVLGLKTGRIEEVFGFEPADIKVTSGRVDVMARDDTGTLYHIEEQRNLEKADMYRFAAYHFLGAKQWGEKITDVILASGDVYAGEKKIVTPSGTYCPLVIDFSRKDGIKRLEEIRQALRDGSFTAWEELVFLPLYGQETGAARSDFAEKVLLFGTELCRAGKISSRLLAATLLMSNKLIDKKRLRELWEEIKMLDILEIAREKGMEEGVILGREEGKSIGIQEGKFIGIQEGKFIGIQEGKSIGIQEGKILSAREMLSDALIEKFTIIPRHISDSIQTIENQDIAKGLFRQALRCATLQEFEEILKKV